MARERSPEAATVPSILIALQKERHANDVGQPVLRKKLRTLVAEAGYDGYLTAGLRSQLVAAFTSAGLHVSPNVSGSRRSARMSFSPSAATRFSLRRFSFKRRFTSSALSRRRSASTLLGTFPSTSIPMVVQVASSGSAHLIVDLLCREALSPQKWGLVAIELKRDEAPRGTLVQMGEYLLELRKAFPGRPVRGHHHLEFRRRDRPKGPWRAGLTSVSCRLASLSRDAQASGLYSTSFCSGAGHHSDCIVGALMRADGPNLRLSPTDLSGFLGCRHRTGLDLAVANGQLPRPAWSDPVAQALRDRGVEHERAYVASMRAQGLRVVEIDDAALPDARVADTLAAMRGGADVIVQAALMSSGSSPASNPASVSWFGYADILQRVPVPSALGAWSYEPCDTKLARETRGGTILQLTVYVDLLEQVQDLRPERFWVVTPGEGGGFAATSYRTADYDAYVRVVHRQLQATLALGSDAILTSHYPEPVEHCDVCRWWERCNDRRRADDHLALHRRHRAACIGAELASQRHPDARGRIGDLGRAHPVQAHARVARHLRALAHHQARLQVELKRLPARRSTSCCPIEEAQRPGAPARAFARRPVPRPRRRAVRARGWPRSTSLASGVASTCLPQDALVYEVGGRSYDARGARRVRGGDGPHHRGRSACYPGAARLPLRATTSRRRFKRSDGPLRHAGRRARSRRCAFGLLRRPARPLCVRACGPAWRATRSSSWSSSTASRGPCH